MNSPDLPPLIEGARVGFLADVTARRREFAYLQAEAYRKFCFLSDYPRRWPAEALRVAIAELQFRNALLSRRLLDAVAAGWRPGPFMDAQGAFARCHAWDNADSHPSQDLVDLATGAFRRVGRASTNQDDVIARRAFSDAQVAGSISVVTKIESEAIKKYGDFRAVQNDQLFREELLRKLHEHFCSGGTTLQTVGVVELLGLQTNDANRLAVGNALSTLLKRGTISAKLLTGEGLTFLPVTVTGLTAEGEALAEGRVHTNAAPIFNIGGNVGYVQTGGNATVTQAFGKPLDDLVKALEALHIEVAEGDVALRSAVSEAVNQASKDNPDRDRLARPLSTVAALVQTAGAAPAAWGLVHSAAVQLGIYLGSLPL